MPRGWTAGRHLTRLTFAGIRQKWPTGAQPDIVATIVDHSCRVDDADGSRLRNALAAAVCADGALR